MSTNARSPAFSECLPERWRRPLSLRPMPVFVVVMRLTRGREASDEGRLTLMRLLRREQPLLNGPVVDTNVHGIEREHARKRMLLDPALGVLPRREGAAREPARLDVL